MPDESFIIDLITQEKVLLAGDIVRDASEENKFYAFIHVTRTKDNSQNPSNHKIKQFADKIEKQGLKISFILVEDDLADLQSNIKSTVFRFFTDDVRNVVISPQKDGIVVWIEPKRVLSDERNKAIQKKVIEICDVLIAKLIDTKFTSSENIPTPTACMNVIRLKAPVTLEGVESELKRRKFHIPSSEWLSKKLDSLRRSKRILRQKNSTFALTLSGLKSLGSRKDRSSPDIVRALDISERGE